MTVDWTKCTHAADARGKKMRVKFVRRDDQGLLTFKFLDSHYTHTAKWLAGELWWFEDNGTSVAGLTLCPPEPQEPPVWALKEACEAIGIRYDTYVKRDVNEWTSASIRAHALTIAETQEAPEDPDLVKAREYAAQHWAGKGYPTLAKSTREGGFDSTAEVQAALLAIKGERA